MNTQTGSIRRYALERLLVLAGTGICVSVTVFIWTSISHQQDMWPLPALYFLEMIAASLAGLWGIYRHDGLGSGLAWSAVGALFGFTMLGALSVGFFYLPVVSLFFLSALWQNRQDWRRLPLYLGLALLTTMAQVGVMLSLIRVGF
jgi:4-amino-4-deoxy-L-arabinose transferase-like glycosyltransferase